TTQTCDAATPVSRIAAFTASPERFMYVWRSTHLTPCASERPTSDLHRLRSTFAPSRSASMRTHANPRLCLVSEYSASGLPSPTIRCSSRFSMRTRKGRRRLDGAPTKSRPQPLIRGVKRRWRGSESTRRRLHTRERERREGEARHLPGLGRGRMIPAKEVQQPVHAQQRELGLLRMAVLPRLADHRRPGDSHIAEMIARPAERPDVGGLSLSRERPVAPPYPGV